MRQNSTTPTQPRRRARSPPPPPRGGAARAPRPARARAARRRTGALGVALRPRIAPRLGATRPRRRRARSRRRHPRARRARDAQLLARRLGRAPAARSACATTARGCRARAHARPRPRPAGRPASAARSCDARARTAPAPRARAGRVPQPITGANPTTSCSTDVANRPDRCRVTEPEQVALDRVRARLQPIITRRRAPPRAARATQQRAHHHAPGLRRQRRARRPIPTTTRRLASGKRCAFQRHRQRPATPGARTTRQRSRADARGAAGPAPSSRERASTSARRPHPRNRGWRSVRRTATVGEERICEPLRSRSGSWSEDRSGRPGCHPGLSRSAEAQRRAAAPPEPEVRSSRN